MKHKIFSPGQLRLGLLLLLILAGCTATSVPMPSSSDPTKSINLAQAANLDTTTQVEIRTLDEASGTYLPTTTITDPTVISTLTAPLDQTLPLQPALFCTAQYEVIFQVADGKALTFNYDCGDEEGGFLQGGNTPLQDEAIEPPVAFQEAFSQQVGSP